MVDKLLCPSNCRSQLSKKFIVIRNEYCFDSHSSSSLMADGAVRVDLKNLKEDPLKSSMRILLLIPLSFLNTQQLNFFAATKSFSTVLQRN